MNRSIDSGILALAKQGRLSATGCMTKGASFFSDAPVLAELAVEKGLHLNLTEAQLNTRFFQPLQTLILNSSLRRVDTQLIQAEIEEQCDGFEKAFGKGPDFVDGHQHVHQLPVIRDVLLKVLSRRYGSERLWIRSTCVPSGIAPWGDGLKAKVIETLGARSLLRQANKAGFKTNRYLLGVYDFSGDAQQYLARLDRWIRLASPGDVLMCHPGNGFDASDPISRQREIEFAVLGAPSFEALLVKHGACVARGSLTTAFQI